MKRIKSITVKAAACGFHFNLFHFCPFHHTFSCFSITASARMNKGHTDNLKPFHAMQIIYANDSLLIEWLIGLFVNRSYTIQRIAE